MNTPLISVVIPVYKVEKYLDRCLNSVVQQTYKNLEIILVDDGSPDACPDMCDAWKDKDSRIKVIHKQNGGLSDARNKGVEIAAGEMIAFVDSDDWINPEMYQRLYDAMLKDGSDIAACDVQMVWENGKPSRLLTVGENHVLTKEQAMESLIEETLIKQPVWYKLYKAELVRQIPFPEGKYHEDAFWSYKVIGLSTGFSIINYVGYNYWQREDSIMGEMYSLRRLDAIEALEERQYYLEKYYTDLSLKAKRILWLSCMYHGQQAISKLSEINERKYAIKYLSAVLKRHSFSSEEFRSISKKEQLWFAVASKSLIFVCKTRNYLKIGV